MIFFIILICIGIYLVLAIAFIAFIAVKFTKRPLYTWLAIAFVILLPTWDVLLGAAVYFPACLFIPKVAIYDTAETEGIYYEGVHDYIYELPDRGRNLPLSERVTVGSIYDDFRKGFTHGESKVVRKKEVGSRDDKPILPTYYYCTPLPRDIERPQFVRMSCAVVDKPMSRYMVKTDSSTIGSTTINHLQIVDRRTGMLMAEYRGATFVVFIPFFNWIDWWWGCSHSVSCPESGGNIIDEVLKPKK